jgi:hypothetical protein
VDYSTFSYEELIEEIAREQRELDRLRGEILTKSEDLRVSLPERERVRSRLSYWTEQRRLARTQRRLLQSRLSPLLDRVKGLERDIRRLRVGLLTLRGYAREVQERLIRGYEAEVVSRRSEWSRVMRSLRRDAPIRTREREAEARYRRELRSFRNISREIIELRSEIEGLVRKAEVEEEEIKKKKKYLPPPPPPKVEIMEVCAYCNYIPGMKGGKGKEREYKILRWIKKNTMLEYEDEMRDLWFKIFDWFAVGPKRLDDENIEYGETNREPDEPVKIEEFEKFQDYILALIMNTKTGIEVQRGEGTVHEIFAEGYDGINWRGPVIFYYNPPPPYKGKKP